MRPVHIPLACIERYTAGESPAALAKEFGISRPALLGRLRRDAIPVRGRREAELLKNANRTVEERQAQALAANLTVRGRSASWAERCKRAATLERTHVHASPNERILAELLAAHGVMPVIQKAVDIYNIDVALWPLAVEVYGGGWHAYGRHRQRSRARFSHLVASGWAPVIVWCIPGVPGAKDWRPTACLAKALVELHAANSSPAAGMYVYRFDGRLLQQSPTDYDVLACIPARAYRRTDD